MKVPAIGDLGGSLRRRPALAATGAGGLCLLAVLLFSGSGGDGAEGRGQAADGSGGDVLAGLRLAVPLPEISLTGGAEEASGPRYAIASVRSGERVEVRDAPEGKVIARLGDRTEFGSLRSFWVQRVDGEWYGVPVAELPNGRLGWIREDDQELELYETPYSVHADISRRALELRYGKRVLERFAVTVGAPGSPTPPGDYAITDGLAGEGVGPYYGCCILALSGHQPNLPPDWLGGDRIAIHGTPGAIGVAASAGCLRASDRDMVSLFARLPLGAPVFIRS